MKKFWIGLSTCLILLAGFVACKAALEPPVLGNKPRTLKPGHVLVRVGTGEFPGYRAIIPDEWTIEKRKNLKYTIQKKDENGDFQNYKSDISWDVLEKGYYLDLSDGTHTFVMIAKNSDSKEVLKSKETMIDIPGAQELSFILKPLRLKQEVATNANTAKGGCNITCIFYNLKAEGYTEYTKAAITLTRKGDIGNENGYKDDNVTIEDYKGENSKRISCVKYKNEDIVPGVYDFELKLSKDNADSITVSDIVIIDSGNTSTGVLDCSGGFETKPNAPTNFRVAYNRPDDASDIYEAVFTWEDNSYNEENYILVIKDENGDNLASQPNVTDVYPNYNEPKLPKLEKNTRKVVVELKLGEKYKASIHATNSFGDSEEVQYKNDETNDLIHLARIKYTLNKGVAVSDESDLLSIKMAASSETAIGYYTQTVDGFMLPANVGLPWVFRPFDTNSGDTLYELKGWYGGSAGTEPVTKLESTVYDNLELTAEWTARQSTEIKFPSYDETCFIEGQNDYIEATTNNEIEIIAKIYVESGYKIEYAKWYVDGQQTNSTSTEDTNNNPQTSTLKETFTSTGIKHVYVTIKLIKDDYAEKWVTAKCLVRVN